MLYKKRIEFPIDELCEKLRYAFSYVDGVLYWKNLNPKSRRTNLLGKVAGHQNPGDRWYITFEKRVWSRSNIVWLYFKGEMPVGDIDHIDRDSFNDKIENLRDITHALNLQNCKLHKDNTSGFRGVWFDKRRNKWCAETANLKFARHFHTAEEAALALEAKVNESALAEVWSGVRP